MTAAELLRYQLDDVGFQLTKCFEPMGDAQLDTKLSKQGMTPRETIEHLCEAYEACLSGFEGKKWEWGAYSIEDKSKENLIETLRQTRERAVAAATSGEGDKRLKEGHAYILAHDAYHVGQLCLINLMTMPDWDPYSIYNFE